MPWHIEPAPRVSATFRGGAQGGRGVYMPPSAQQTDRQTGGTMHTIREKRALAGCPKGYRGLSNTCATLTSASSLRAQHGNGRGCHREVSGRGIDTNRALGGISGNILSPYSLRP